MLEATVRSVVDGSGSARVIVVDNGESALALLEAAPDGDRRLSDAVTVISAGSNGGYAAGMNLGIAAALAGGAQAVALLNDDVEVADGWLEPLLGELDASTRVGIAQPLLIETGTDTINSAGVTIDKYGAGSDIDRGRSVDDLNPAPSDIEGFTGGAVVVSRSFLDDVGSFDERFFLYYEDVELSRRAQRCGWRARLVPASHVWHRGSATTASMGDDVRRLQERNRIWSSALHGSPIELARGVGLSLRRLRHAPHAAHRRALLDGLIGLPAVLRVRLRNHPPSAARRIVSRLRSAQRQRMARRLRGTPGVNIVGYHHISSGLGSIAREMSDAFREAGVPVVEVDNDLSTSPRRRPARPTPAHLHDTTIALVTAFEFALFCERYPELTGPGKRIIGYWLWELAEVPDQHRDAMSLVDEVWAPTTFVREAYARVAPEGVAVRLVPLRMPEPDVDDLLVREWRSRWNDDVVFVVSFDYLSIVERKNPHGAIEAFRTAFPDHDGQPQVRLVVKSINGDQRPDDVASTRAVCGGDPRIEFVDEHLDDAHHHALLAAADCLVSLHRSEGYGLHPALAMWLGTAVVATRYSSVTDFMDHRCAAMVDAELVHVTNGQGIYPETAVWAEPDLDQAAALLRRLAFEPDFRARLVERARRRIADQPTAAQFGEAFAAVLRAPGASETGESQPFFDGLDVARGVVGRIRNAMPGRVAAWPDTARR